MHEDPALVGDTVNVRCFPNHQAAVIATGLHPANVIAHDEHDVGFRICRLAVPHASHERRRNGQDAQTVRNCFSYFTFHGSVFGCMLFLLIR
jgi:hypothetical protein